MTFLFDDEHGGIYFGCVPEYIVKLSKCSDGASLVEKKTFR